MRIFLTDYCIVNFNVIIHLKWKSNKWIANIEYMTLEGFKDYICKMYQLFAFKNDRTEFKFINDEDIFTLERLRPS
jgi:hypothetical protein